MISAVFGTGHDQPRCGCGRAERSRRQDPHVRTPARRTSCAAVVESSPSTRWKMSVARNVICWRRLTGLFLSDTPGCDRSGWICFARRPAPLCTRYTNGLNPENNSGIRNVPVTQPHRPTICRSQQQQQQHQQPRLSIQFRVRRGFINVTHWNDSSSAAAEN